MSQLLFDDITATVQVGFSTTAGANTVPFGGLLADITWTDITAYVRGLSFQRGRSTELEQFQTGSASVVLSNADRRFDPLYASSPYAGALTPLRPIRIFIEHVDGSGTSRPTALFFGYIDGWPQTYETFGDATVTINASDMFKVLNNLTLPGLWEYTIDNENPLAWLRFNDGSTTRLVNQGSESSTWYWSDPTIGGLSKVTGKSVAGLIADDSNQAGEFTDGTFVYSGDYGSLPTSSDRAFEFWFSTTEQGNETYPLCKFGDGKYGVYGHVLSFLGYGTVQFCIGDATSGSSTFDVYTSAGPVNDGNPHHVVVNYGTTPGLYVDGVEATKTASNLPTEYVFGGGSNGGLGGNFYYTSTYNGSQTFNGVIDEFLIWSSNLSAATIVQHYTLGAGTFQNGERTDQRAARILDMIQWPADARDLGIGLSTVQGARTQGKTSLAALQEVEAAEQGMLFADGGGSIKFITRYNFNQQPTVATFGDSSGELGYQNIVIEQSDADIANQITVSRANGGSSTQTDATSQAAYWPRTLEVTDLIVDDDAFAEQLAIDLLRRYKTPQTRIRSLSGTVRGRSAADIQTMLDVAIGDKVTVKRRPQGVGSAISQNLQIQSVNGELGTDNMVLSFELGPQPTQGFVLDSSTNGVLDTSRLAL